MNVLLGLAILATQVLSYSAVDTDKLFFYSDGKPTYIELVQDKAVVRFKANKENDLRNSLQSTETLTPIAFSVSGPEKDTYGVVALHETLSYDVLCNRLSQLRQQVNATAAWPVFTLSGRYTRCGEVFFANTFYVSFKAETSVANAEQLVVANGAIPVKSFKEASGRTRCLATVPRDTAVDAFLSIVNKICELPEVHYARPDIHVTVQPSRSQSGQSHNGIVPPSVSTPSGTAISPARGRALATLNPALTAPQWSRVLPVYCGWPQHVQPPDPVGFGQERRLVDNPSANCKAVMVSSLEISNFVNNRTWCDRLTDISYELDNGVLVAADLGYFGQETWEEGVTWCRESVIAGVYLICTDEQSTMDADDFDYLYTECKGNNENVLVCVYNQLIWSIEDLCNNLHNRHGYYPDAIGMHWDIDSGYSFFQRLLDDAHTWGIKSFMYICPHACSNKFGGCPPEFYKSYYQADAVFIWASDNLEWEEPPPDMAPWDTVVKPLIDGLLGPTSMRVRTGATDIAMFDKNGNLIVNGTNHDHASSQTLEAISPPEFIIRDHTGSNVLRMSNAGELYLKGTLHTGYDVSTITEAGVFRVEGSRAVCTQSGDLYISGMLYDNGRP